MSNKRSSLEENLEGYRSTLSGSLRLHNAGWPRPAKAKEILAPHIAALGHRPFTASELDSLARWLQDPVWPLGSMNIYTLEGYLTALLVMPLGLHTGIWMPAIWSENGWNIPLALQEREKHHEFTELVIGYMRSIDAGLSATEPKFKSVCESAIRWSSRPASLNSQDWVQGFGKALHLCSHLNLTDLTVKTALHAIAAQAHESNEVNRTNGKANAAIRQAVLSLAKTRLTRGPLSEPVVVTRIK